QVGRGGERRRITGDLERGNRERGDGELSGQPRSAHRLSFRSCESTAVDVRLGEHCSTAARRVRCRAAESVSENRRCGVQGRRGWVAPREPASREKEAAKWTQPH